MKIINVGPAPRLVWVSGKLWRLVDPYRVFLEDEDGEVWSVTVPREFMTDGPSVPKPLSSFFPTRGASFHASIFHDYVYSQGKKSWEAMGFNRRDSDRLFWDVARHLGVGKVAAFWGWLGVRLGGWTKY